MADLLNIGSSGLLAYQRALTTVSHNITNANTEGYSRQSVELATQKPQFSGAGYEGSGVKVAAVRRNLDQFLEGQLSTSLSTFKQQEKLASLSAELDNFLADADVGISPTLQNFFKAVQDVSTDPSSSTARQVLLSESETLSAVFNDTYTKLDTIKNGLNVDISVNLEEINSLSQGIAGYNKEIARAQGGSDKFPPNDLLDQRQDLVNKLAELVKVSTLEQDDGSLNVFIGKGQSLVIGSESRTLSVLRSEFDPTRLDIGLKTGSTVSNITAQLSGGEIGGLLEFRNNLLNQSYATVGLLAVALSEDMNAQHQLGYDLNGQLGGNFFNDITVTNSTASSSNAPSTDTIFQSTVTDSNRLQASDYRLDYSGGNYTLTRLNDNSVIAGPLGLAALTTAVEASEGFSIALASGATISDGDRFLLAPVRNGSRDLAVSINDTKLIAAASPLRFAQSSTNSGNASISQDLLVQRTGNSLPAAPITLTFDDVANVFNLSSGGSIAYDPATDSGSSLQVAVAGLGSYQFTLTGTPANGDVFTLGTNTNGISDNRNALAMVALQQQKQVNNGSADYQAAFTELVTDVGVKTRQAEFGRNSSGAIYERVFAAQQEVSGVNLDEEAANLLKFQQAYQAVARVITTADELFQTLLGAVSR